MNANIITPYIYAYTSMYMNTCVRIAFGAFINVNTLRTCIYVYINMYVDICVRIDMCVCIYMSIYTYEHKRLHFRNICA